MRADRRPGLLRRRVRLAYDDGPSPSSPSKSSSSSVPRERSSSGRSKGTPAYPPASTSCTRRRRTASKTQLEGFVHAVGEGHIACFGISVNFEVKVVHEDSGTVTGSATYRFSFRVGFVKVGYGVTATYGFNKNDSARAFTSPSRPRLLTAGACPPLPDKTREWLCYRDHFVSDWP